MNEVIQYMFSRVTNSGKGKFELSGTPDIVMRPTRLVTNIKEECLVIIEQI